MEARLIADMASLVRAKASEPRNRPYVVAINGIDAAGKTSFTHDLSAALGQADICLVHLDDFHHPRAFRNAGADPVANYLERTFDFERFEREVLEPLRRPNGLSKSLSVLDLASDRFGRTVRYEVHSGSIVLIEGVFLFQPRWLHYFDLKVFLAVEEAAARRRGIERDRATMGEAVAERYDSKYLPAQRLYVERCQPAECADIVIDVTDWGAPRVAKP